LASSAGILIIDGGGPQVMIDSHTQRSRGFGFVTFDSCDPVEEGMKRQDHNIDGKNVEIKKAFPKVSPTLSRSRRG